MEICAHAPLSLSLSCTRTHASSHANTQHAKSYNNRELDGLYIHAIPYLLNGIFVSIACNSFPFPLLSFSLSVSFFLFSFSSNPFLSFSFFFLSLLPHFFFPLSLSICFLSFYSLLLSFPFVFFPFPFSLSVTASLLCWTFLQCTYLLNSLSPFIDSQIRHSNITPTRRVSYRRHQIWRSGAKERRKRKKAIIGFHFRVEGSGGSEQMNATRENVN